MAFLPLFLSVSEKRLVKSASSVDGYDIPDLIQGEKLDIEFQALNRIRFSPTPGGGSPFAVINLQGYALTINIGSLGDVNATQSSWTPSGDNNKLSGVLDLNTVDMNNLAEGTAQFFEIVLTTATTRLVHRPFFIFRKAVSVPGGALPAPVGDTGLGANQASQLYIPKRGVAGGGFTLVSADGLKTAFVYLDNNGDFQCNPVT